MDDFEKELELGGETPSADNEAFPAENADQPGLDEELEDIRELFQKELDAARTEAEKDIAYETADGEVLIQSLEGMGLELPESEELEETDTDEDEVIDEEDLCRCCGQKRRDTAYGEDYPYCDECRNLMKHNPLNAIGVFVTIIVILVAGLAFGLMARNIQSYTTLVDAETARDSNKLSTALVSYLKYLDTADADGVYSKAAVEHGSEILAKMGHFDYASKYIEKFYDEKALKSFFNKNIADINAYAAQLEETASYVSETYGEDMNAGKFEETIKKLDKDIASFSEDEETKDKYNIIYLEYVKYYLMEQNGDDKQDVLDQLLKLERTDADKYGSKNAWIYLTYIIRQYARLGDIEGAKQYSDKTLALNSQDVYAYIYYADAFRFSLNKKSSEDELKAASDEIAKLAEACSNEYDPQFSYPVFYRLYAISYLLTGQDELALKNMQSYLSEAGGALGSIGDYNLFALCCLVNDDEETYTQIKSNLEMQGYSLSDAVMAFADGKGSVLEVLTDVGGEI